MNLLTAHYLKTYKALALHKDTEKIKEAIYLSKVVGQEACDLREAVKALIKHAPPITTDDEISDLVAYLGDASKEIEDYRRSLDGDKDAAERARRRAAIFTFDDEGNIMQAPENVAVAIAEMGASVRFNELKGVTEVSGLPGFGPELDDASVIRLWIACDQRFGFKVKKEYFYDVILDIARINKYHPVRDYLDSLVWDSVPRLEKWLYTYLGAADDEYTNTVGRLVLLAAVRRIRQPGAKFDEMVILESEQGKGKSTALRTLCKDDAWFSDDLRLDVSTREQMESLSGHWIVEAGELKGLKKSDVASLKSFLSRTTDRARLAYGRLVTHMPRQCVIIGTTNDEDYLSDPTGNRRFWPVPTGAISLEKLREDRDALWAEASALEATGASLRLPEHLWPVAAVVQEGREAIDPSEHILIRWLGDTCKPGMVACRDVYDMLGLDAMATTGEAQRVGAVMRRLGWQHTRRRQGNVRTYCFRRGGDNWLIVKRDYTGVLAVD